MNLGEGNLVGSSLRTRKWGQGGGTQVARRTPREEGIRIHPQGILGPCFIPPNARLSDHLRLAQGHGQRGVSPSLLSPAPRLVPGSWSLQMNRSPSWNKRSDRSHHFFLEKHKQAKCDVGQIRGKHRHSVGNKNDPEHVV